MNVRDFLFNFVESSAKICVQKNVNCAILFYGKAGTLEHIDVLNKIVECVDYDKEAGCLTITVSRTPTGATYHLPEEQDHVY